MLSLRLFNHVSQRACAYTTLPFPVDSRNISQRLLIASRFHSIFSHSCTSKYIRTKEWRSFSSSQLKEGFAINKAGKIALFLLMGSVVLTSAGLYAFNRHGQAKESNLQAVIDTKVLGKIEYSSHIPGLTPEEFFTLKSEISKNWANLIKDGVLEVTGTDKAVRPSFVAIQGLVEHVLASELQKSITTLKGVIHTPMPATPLCNKGEISKELAGSSVASNPTSLSTFKAKMAILRECFFAGPVILAYELQKKYQNSQVDIHTPMPATPLCNKGEISKEWVDPSIASNPASLATVNARTTIVRDYLFKGGNLYIAYPKAGYHERTEEQQKIYQQELMNYSGHLFDTRLNCAGIPSELIGATYLFQDQSGNDFVFAIQMTQAKNPQEVGHFGLWLGPIQHPAIQRRLQAVSNHLEGNGVSILAQNKKGQD